MDESLLAWIAAIESGFARSAEWVAWADRGVALLDDPPLWMIDLSLVDSTERALAVLWAARKSVDPVLWDRIDCIGLYLGFLFLRFERGDLTMRDLLTEAGQRADTANYRIDCGTFYSLASEIDGNRPPFFACDGPLEQRVVEVFRPFVETARRVWWKLNSDHDWFEI